MKKLLPLAVVFCAALATPAYAGYGDFAVVGAGCVPESTSSAYTISNGVVTFAGSATGTITMWCAIPFTMDQPGTFELQATDNSASGYVYASYIKVNANTGGQTYIQNVTSADNADGLPHYVVKPVSDAYDASNWRYVVRVILNRTSTTATVKFYGLSLY